MTDPRDVMLGRIWRWWHGGIDDWEQINKALDTLISDEDIAAFYRERSRPKPRRRRTHDAHERPIT